MLPRTFAVCLWSGSFGRVRNAKMRARAHAAQRNGQSERLVYNADLLAFLSNLLQHKHAHSESQRPTSIYFFFLVGMRVRPLQDVYFVCMVLLHTIHTLLIGCEYVCRHSTTDPGWVFYYTHATESDPQSSLDPGCLFE